MNSITGPIWSKVPFFSTSENTQIDLKSYGGRLDVKWDQDAKVTPYGGLAFFAQFLKDTGLFERLCSDFPIDYKSNNSCTRRDIVGTIVLAILTAKTRYVQINDLRNDTAAMELLDLNRIVSEDTVRRALRQADCGALDAWLSRHEHEVFDGLLPYGYIIDIDNTVKPVYGRQEGAEVGYNPQKPGRPSLNYHTFFISGARIVLGVDVLPGKKSSGSHGISALRAFIETLDADRMPFLLRGDVGYGSDGIMSDAELHGLKYLFKVSRSLPVKRMFNSLSDSGGWKKCGSGWEAHESRLRMGAWESPRRCIFVRRPAAKGRPADPAGQKEGGAPEQQLFEFAKGMEGRGWDYCALVTNNETLDATALSQLYRDRGDCENNFDEFKNQWGWSGFTTKRLQPCKAMARLIAIVSNWWNVFTRMAEPDVHREPVTSRPAYLNIVGRITTNGGRRVLRLTSTHADARAIRGSLNLIGQFLKWVTSIAEQLTPNELWAVVLAYAFRKLLNRNPRWDPVPALPQG